MRYEQHASNPDKENGYSVKPKKKKKKGRIGGSAFDASGNYEPWETGARGEHLGE